MNNEKAVVRAVRQMHPDPFVQAAILRLYAEAPGLLDSAAYVALADAEGLDAHQMLTTLAKSPRRKIGA
jgi:hypothetical protein